MNNIKQVDFINLTGLHYKFTNLKLSINGLYVKILNSLQNLTFLIGIFPYILKSIYVEC